MNSITSKSKLGSIGSVTGLTYTNCIANYVEGVVGNSDIANRRVKVDTLSSINITAGNGKVTLRTGRKLKKAVHTCIYGTINYRNVSNVGRKLNSYYTVALTKVGESTSLNCYVVGITHLVACILLRCKDVGSICNLSGSKVNVLNGKSACTIKTIRLTVNLNLAIKGSVITYDHKIKTGFLLDDYILINRAFTEINNRGSGIYVFSCFKCF